MKYIVSQVEQAFALREEKQKVLERNLKCSAEQLKYLERQTQQQAILLSKLSASLTHNVSKYQEVESNYIIFKNQSFDILMTRINNLPAKISECKSL